MTSLTKGVSMERTNLLTNNHVEGLTAGLLDIALHRVLTCCRTNLGFFCYFRFNGILSFWNSGLQSYCLLVLHTCSCLSASSETVSVGHAGRDLAPPSYLLGLCCFIFCSVSGGVFAAFG